MHKPILLVSQQFVSFVCSQLQIPLTNVHFWMITAEKGIEGKKSIFIEKQSFVDSSFYRQNLPYFCILSRRLYTHMQLTRSVQETWHNNDSRGTCTGWFTSVSSLSRIFHYSTLFWKNRLYIAFLDSLYYLSFLMFL